MKDLLIIFCVLLFVLIVISTLGGSIRPGAEAFEEEEELLNERNVVENYRSANEISYEHYEVSDEQPKHEAFTGDATSPDNGGDVVAGFDNADTFASF